MTDKNKGIGAMPGDGILEDSIVFNLLDIPFKEFTPGQVIQSKQFNDDMNDIEEKVNEMIQKGEAVRQHYANHAGSKGNPHEVTAHQVGAYNVEDVDTFISDLKDGDLNDKSITNRVLADECVDNRVLKNKSITATKVEEAFGTQIDISQNMDILDRYTKTETDEIIKSKVGDGTYTKDEIDKKLHDVQAGQIVDKSISVEQLKDDVGRLINLSLNPSIMDRYTKVEVDTLIRQNGMPRDWGSITDEVEDDSKSLFGHLPVAGVMTCGEFKTALSTILDIDVQEVVDSRGSHNGLPTRLNVLEDTLDSIINMFKEVIDNE